jgi:hypothetical protein
MTIKKEYAVGDAVWIYNGGPKNRLIKGKVIKILDLSDQGWSVGPHYIIEIPTHIDPLLEIRTWDTISQDEHGPVGCFREIGDMIATIKKVKTTGFAYDESYDEDDISPDQIHAALEKSRQGTSHQPLVIKEPKPRRRSYKRKKL